MADVFDPKIIGAIQRLELRAKRLVEGSMIGVHRSPYRGISTDFAEHRLYVQGDDLRHLDWKLFARSDRYYVKRYEQETNMDVRFLVDTSRSMFYKSDDAILSKFDYGATIASSLAYLLLKQSDAIGLNTFDSDIRTTIPPRSTFEQFKRITDTLEKSTPGDDTELGNALTKLGIQIKRRSMVIVISDFVDDLSALSNGLSMLNYKGNEVILMRIEDPWEKNFPFTGRTIFLGVENEGKLNCDPRDLRQHYLNERGRHIAELYDICRQQGFLMDQAVTDEPLEGVLIGFLNMRAGARR